MATTLGTIRSEESLLAAAQRMREKRIGSLLTIEAGEIVGIVTESDLVRKGLVCKLDSASTRSLSVTMPTISPASIVSNDPIRFSRMRCPREATLHCDGAERVVAIRTLSGRVYTVSSSHTEKIPTISPPSRTQR